MRIILLLLLSLVSLTSIAQKKTRKPVATIAKADSLFSAGSWELSAAQYEAAFKNQAQAKEARAWYRLGASYFNLEQYGKAHEAFLAAEKLNPRQQGVRLGLARTFAWQKNSAKSLEMLDSMARAGFANFKMIESDQMFVWMRDDQGFKKVVEKIMFNAYPCMGLPHAHDFDFWLGDWDVFLTSNLYVKTGFNRITRASQGCVILENWEAAGGPHVGMSMNYYDPTAGKWREKWVGSAQDIQEFYDGEYTDNAMRFKFDGRNPDGTMFQGRLTFSNLEPGKVRQHSEKFDEGQKAWTTIYDFTYIRRN